MANISITEKGGLFTITLDKEQDGWVGLIVNGNEIVYDNGWTYSQMEPGPLAFVATSSLTQVTMPDAIILQSPDSKNAYVAVLNFTTMYGTLQLNGTLLAVGTSGFGFTQTQVFGASGVTVAFDQPSLTGSFSAT